ncbi:unnamed protein product, partial [Laminaria digitata]
GRHSAPGGGQRLEGEKRAVRGTPRASQKSDGFSDYRWRGAAELRPVSKERSSFGAQALPHRGDAQPEARQSVASQRAYRRLRSRSGSVVDNEGFQEALEQAEEEGRRRSSGGLGSSTRSSPSARQSWGSPPIIDQSAAVGRESGGRTSLAGTGGKGSSGKVSRSGRSSVGWKSGSGGGGEGVGGAARDDDNAATAYSRALARVRHETVQEGLRHGHGREREATGRHAQTAKDPTGTPPDDDSHGKAAAKTPVSLKHAMSRVKDQSKPSSARPLTPPELPATGATLETANAAAAAGSGGGGGAPALSDASPGHTLRAGGRPSLSAEASTAALRASIESGMTFDDDDDERDDGDEDSPRNRGRQYDDRWKVPGHAESVLASFVERLEHRGHTLDDENLE